MTASPTGSAAALQVTVAGAGTGAAINGVANNSGTGVAGSTAKATKFGMIAQNTAVTHSSGGALQALGGYENAVVATSRYDGVSATSSGAGSSGVYATNTGGGFGVYGQTSSTSNPGVFGINDSGDGVLGSSDDLTHAGVSGENTNGGFGVYGATASDTRAAVFGTNALGDGIKGTSADPGHSGVYAVNTGGGYGLFGSTSSAAKAAVLGSNPSGDGVKGSSNNSNHSGVNAANTNGGWGLYASTNGASHPAIYGTNQLGDGIEGFSNNSTHSGVYGHNAGGGYGIYGTALNNATAGVFGGNALGDGIKAQSGAVDHSGLYARNTGGGFGVFAETDTNDVGRPAIWAQNTATWDGMDSDTPIALWAKAPGGVGVVAETSSSRWSALATIGTARVNGDLIVTGSKDGYVADIAMNGSTLTLHQGDAVTISSVAPPVIGQIPLIVVRPAGRSDHVIGVVDRRMVVSQPMGPINPATPQLSNVYADGTTVAPNEHLLVVTLGSFLSATVSASQGAINPGDSLAVTGTPGVLAKQHGIIVQGIELTAPGTSVGYALGTLSEGTDRIAVFVNPH